MPIFKPQPMNGFGPPPGFAQPRILGADGLPYRDTDQGYETAGDGLAIPHVYQFGSVLSGAQKTYFHYQWDEARRNSRENAMAMERDVFLAALMQERKLAVASQKWHIEVDDEKDPYQKALKDGLMRIFRATPYLMRHHYAAEDAIWYGRHGVQRQYEWKELDLPNVNFKQSVPGVPNAQGISELSGSGNEGGFGGGEGEGAWQGAGGVGAVAANGAPAVVTSRTQRRRCQVVKKHQPVHGDSIGHKWDGTPYILVYSPMARRLADQGAEVFDPRSQDPVEPGEVTLTTGGSYGLVLRDPYWRDRFIIHSHVSIAGEFFDPQRAEAIHGVGVRDVLYWFWHLKTEYLDWVVTYYERVGMGLTLWYFEAGNKKSFDEVNLLAKQNIRKTNILVPWHQGKSGQGVGGVDRLETPIAGAEALMALKREIEEQAERYVVGQAGSSRSDAKGLGTHDTSFQRDTKFQITKFDAENLADTYTQDWVKTVQEATFPEWADIPARWAFNVADPEAAKKMAAAEAAYSMGVSFKEEEVRGLTGLSDPQEGDEVLNQADQAALLPQAALQSPLPGSLGPNGGNLPDATLSMPFYKEGEKERYRVQAQDPAGLTGRMQFVKEGDVLAYGPMGPEPGVERAAEEVERRPTEAQKEAGNYKKGHVQIQGLPITIETPKGVTRSGKTQDGKEWSVKMAHHYGYIKRTESEADGDHIDVFIGPHPESEIVFVINQLKSGGKFDEHKCMVGFLSAKEAKDGYLACYSSGWEGFGSMVPMLMDQFKDWIENGDTSKETVDDWRPLKGK